jgi:hypothetical protein
MAKLVLLSLILASPFTLYWAPFDMAQEIWLLMYVPYAVAMLVLLYQQPIQRLKVWIFLIPIGFVLLSVTLLPLWILVTEGLEAASEILLLCLTWTVMVAPFVAAYSIIIALLILLTFKRFGWIDDAA